jgi:hypothetical protein
MRTVCEQRSSSLGLSTELVTGSIPIFAMSLASGGSRSALSEA